MANDSVNNCTTSVVVTLHHNQVIAIHVLMNGNEREVKEVELLAVFGTSVSKGFLDNGVPETIKERNILGQRLRPGVFKEKQIL